MCVITSCYGSYYFICEALKDFHQNSVSMVVDSLRPQELTHFPSVGVCEMGNTKQLYNNLEGIVERFLFFVIFTDSIKFLLIFFFLILNVSPPISLKVAKVDEYNYDVEDYLLRVIFQNLYNFGSYISYCSPYKDCDDCTRCPDDGYAEFAKSVRKLQLI